MKASNALGQRKREEKMRGHLIVKAEVQKGPTGNANCCCNISKDMIIWTAAECVPLLNSMRVL